MSEPIDEILATSHNGQCSHGAFYMNPTELRMKLEAWAKDKMLEIIGEDELTNELTTKLGRSGNLAKFNCLQARDRLRSELRSKL